MLAKPEVDPQDWEMVKQMYQGAIRGWYTGDYETLKRYGQRRVLIGRTSPELSISLLLSRDRMHHSVGWWRNAEYEYCWHLSIAAFDRAAYVTGTEKKENIPPAEERYWAHAFFPLDFDKIWHEPGGTDPRLTPEEARARRGHMSHLRLFLDPETFEPFIPAGEVYDLTRWIPGLTPEKVDR